MARSAAVTGEKKATLWGLIISVAGYVTWFVIWFWVFWIGSLKGLNDLGFNRIPDATWWGLVVIVTLLSILMSMAASSLFTDFKKWAKNIELF